MFPSGTSHRLTPTGGGGVIRFDDIVYEKLPMDRSYYTQTQLRESRFWAPAPRPFLVLENGDWNE